MRRPRRRRLRTVIMIAAVGVLGALGLGLWYKGLNGAFNTAGSRVTSLTGNMQSTFTGS